MRDQRQCEPGPALHFFLQNAKGKHKEWMKEEKKEILGKIVEGLTTWRPEARYKI